MLTARPLAFLVAAAVAFVRPLDAQAPPPPIIDMHMHALEADAQGPPPMAMCTAQVAGFPAVDPGHPWPDSFMEHFKKPPASTIIFAGSSKPDSGNG